MLDLPSIVVFASWALFAVTWFIAALFVKRTVERSWSFGRSSMIVVLAVGYWIARNRQLIGARQLWTPTPSIEWLAAAVVLVGLWVTLWARFALGRNWSGTVTFKQDHELIERGPYRYVRHPIYTGILFAILGTGLCFGKLRDFIVLLVVLGAFWIKLKIEESLMCQQFPDTYPKYRQGTKALIPYLF